MTRKHPHAPRFGALDKAECTALLDRNVFGRLAFLNAGTVDIEPLSYVRDGDWLFLRSAPGTKLEAFAHRPYVAMEFDEIEGMFDWRSVVVHGTIYVLPGDGGHVGRESYERALASIRSVVPEVLTDEDPAPERTIVYGLHIDRMTGRSASTAG